MSGKIGPEYILQKISGQLKVPATIQQITKWFQVMYPAQYDQLPRLVEIAVQRGLARHIFEEQYPYICTPHTHWSGTTWLRSTVPELLTDIIRRLTDTINGKRILQQGQQGNATKKIAHRYIDLNHTKTAAAKGKNNSISKMTSRARVSEPPKEAVVLWRNPKLILNSNNASAEEGESGEKVPTRSKSCPSKASKKGAARTNAIHSMTELGRNSEVRFGTKSISDDKAKRSTELAKMGQGEAPTSLLQKSKRTPVKKVLEREQVSVCPARMSKYEKNIPSTKGARQNKPSK